MPNYKIGRLKDIAEYLFDPRRDIELFGMYGFQNIGDEAMKDAGLASLPKGRTVAVVPGTRLPLLGAMIERKVRPHLVVGGGTLIHGGSPEQGDKSWIDSVDRFVKAGAHVAFMGTGISFLPEQLEQRTRAVTRWAEILGRADYVGLRGPISQQRAAALGVKAEIFGDAAFALHRPGLADQPRDKDRIGFNFGECLGDQAHYEAVNALMLARAAKDFHCVIYVVRPSDHPFTQRIIALSGIPEDRYEIVEIVEDVAAYMDSVSRLHAFIGVKLHAAGLAMVAGVPSLLFEYMAKCRDFMLPIGMENTLIPLDADAHTALAKLETLLGDPDAHRNDKRIGEMARAQQATIDRYFAQFPRG